MEIIKSYRNKKKSYNYSKIIFFAIINILAILYIIDYITINSNEKNYLIRELDERENGPNEICMEFDGNTKYDLFKLGKEILYLNDNKVQLNFCHNIHKTDSSCIYKKSESEIKKLAGNIKGEKHNKNKIEIIDKKVVKIILAAGEECQTDQKYKIEIELSCNKKAEILENINETEFKPDENCGLRLRAESKYACGKDDEYIELEEFERIIAGIVAIIIGLIIGIFGYNQIKIGMLVCFFGSVVLAGLIAVLFDITDLIILIVIGVVFLLGGIALFIFFKKKKKYLKYYMLLIGGLCGYPIGYLIYNLFFSIIDTDKQKLLHIIIIVVCIILGVILGIFFPKHTYIIGTSVIGAYLMMRGIGFLLYGKIDFIDEQKLYDLALSGNYEKIADMVWGEFLIYPAILIFGIIVFIIVQIKINPKWKDFDSYKDYSDSEQVDDSPGEADFKLMERTEDSVKPGTKPKEDEENKDN